jgi:ribonuclease P/MRP protein subunit RPP25
VNEILTGKLGVEVDSSTVVIRGVASAMENVIRLAEVVKHRFAGLHQLNSIQTIEIVDEYEPLEEGLDHLIFKRYNTLLTVTLSR